MPRTYPRFKVARASDPTMFGGRDWRGKMPSYARHWLIWSRVSPADPWAPWTAPGREFPHIYRTRREARAMLKASLPLLLALNQDRRAIS